MLIIFQRSQMFKSNVVVPIERPSHKEYSCKIPNSSTLFGKGIKKVKDFEKYVNFQSQGYRVNNFGTHGKALSLEINSSEVSKL